MIHIVQRRRAGLAEAVEISLLRQQIDNPHAADARPDPHLPRFRVRLMRVVPVVLGHRRMLLPQHSASPESNDSFGAIP